MPKYYHNINNELVAFTAEEEIARDAEIKEWNDAKVNRKLIQIKQIRLEKLQETDYLSNSDVTMLDNIKTWRQNLRNLPQDNSTEEEYDLLLARDSEGNLTNAIWSKP
tara:strand:+ start:710 stop:1033 length:324 start_codon:yes stop_codon:yes gene_type:complete